MRLFPTPDQWAHDARTRQEGRWFFDKEIAEHIRTIELIFNEILTDKQKAVLKLKGVDVPFKEE
jgi:hypothetical protein